MKIQKQKKELIDRLCNLYNENSLNEKDECTILDTLTFIGFDIRLL